MFDFYKIFINCDSFVLSFNVLNCPLFFTDNQPFNNGYVKPMLVTHVPGWSSPSMGGQTPSHSSVVGMGGQTPSNSSVVGSGQGGTDGSYPSTPNGVYQVQANHDDLAAVDGDINLEQLSTFTSFPDFIKSA